MSDLTFRKKVEVRGKFQSLDTDFKYWRGLSGNDLSLHKTQIEGLIGEKKGSLTNLYAILDGEVKRLESEKDAAKILSHAKPLEEMVLAAHCIWGFFREKFAQRLDASTRQFLDIADELAWSCYEPAMKAVGVKKEQPLVFLNSAWSPFMIPRGARWSAEGVPSDLLSDEEFTGVLRTMPLPIIGVPYPQVTHLPDVIFVAHETGHAVEGDFNLTDSLQKAIKAKLPNSTQAADWEQWMGECFADAWAVAHVGPAYVAALEDFLAPAHSRAGDKNYPPAALRIRLGCAFLEALDDQNTPGAQNAFSKEALRLRQEWTNAGLTDAKLPHDEDLKGIAQALLLTPLPQLAGKTAKELGNYNSGQHDRAIKTANQAMQNFAIETKDTRVLFSALRRCYENDPVKFEQKQPGSASISERFIEKLTPTKTTRAARASGAADPKLYDQLTKILGQKN